MKIAAALFSFTIILPITGAQEFMGPSEYDLMAVNLNFIKMTEEISMSGAKLDCSKDGVVESVKPEPPKERTINCICELPSFKESKSGMFESFIGKYESSELDFITGNDNFLHGFVQGYDNLKKYDGNDRGRTFGGGIDYTLNGSEGKLGIKLDSTGFGRFSPQNGWSRAENGEYYLNYREVNTLKLTADKYISKNEASKTFVTGEFKFTNETDNGNLSRSVQQWWHKASKEALKRNVIQYRYMNEEKDRNTISLLGGIGKEWMVNLGNWKCDLDAKVKFGMSVDNNKEFSGEIMARAGGKLQHSALPWLALSTWIQKSNGFQGMSTESGVMLSVEKKIKNVIVRPFIGIERHRTELDRKYGSDGKPYEKYHVLGVTIKY